MTVEIHALEQVRQMCDMSERSIRSILVGEVTYSDFEVLIHEMALVKFYTWETLVQGPEVQPGEMELDWDQVYYFEDKLSQLSNRELVQELCFLMPRFITWLRTAPNLTRRPGCEVWRRFAILW